MTAQLTQLSIVDVIDQGIEMERLFIKVNGPIDLGDVIVYDNTYDDEDYLSNKERHFYRFPAQKVVAGDYVFLATRLPTNASHILPNENGRTTYAFGWGLDHSIWNQGADKATVALISHETRKPVK